MVTLYACLGSGNCFKPWLTLKQLRKTFEVTLIDVLNGEQKGAEYLEINPLGVVPYLLTSNGVGIGESNAMIWYLAEGTHLLPDSAADRAEALQWMFFEQSKLEPFISPARFFTTILPEQRAPMSDEIAEWQGKAKPGLRRLDGHFRNRKFVLRSNYSVADIAMYGYVHVLEEAGLFMDDYPNIARWINDVTKTDNFSPVCDLGQSVAQLERSAG